MTAAAIVRTARTRSGLSQVQLSVRSGVAQSSLSQIENGDRVPTWQTAERLLRAAGWTVVAVPTIRGDVASAARAVRAALDVGDQRSAVRHVIQLADDLAAEHDDVRFALTLSEPESTGREEWDAALAAVAEHRLAEESLPLPRWVRGERQRLENEWTFGSDRYPVAVPRDRVPKAFLDRGVIIDRETLDSV